jgi:hypothetical protein
MDRLLKIRQDADTAATIIEKLGNTVEPALRKAVAAHFSVDEEQEGELSLEFLQGFYFLHRSGLWPPQAHRQCRRNS